MDYISGLSPSIAIEQRSISHNPRSTVATVTEVYDYLRLLYSKAGEVHCHLCGKPVKSMNLEGITAEILGHYANQTILILAPVVRGRKGEFQKVFQDALKAGYSRARIDGKTTRLQPKLKLRKTQRHDIEIVIDVLKVTAQGEKVLGRSLKSALELAKDTVMIVPERDQTKKDSSRLFSTRRACADCQTSYPEFTPNMFSFNSPYGACPECHGLGKLSKVVSGGILADKTKPLLQGGLNQELFFSFNRYVIEELISDLAHEYDFEWKTPFCDWPDAAREAFFWGDAEQDGLISILEKLLHETSSEEIRRKVRRFLVIDTCEACRGRRLKPESLGVTVAGKNIVEMTGLPIEEADSFFQTLKFPQVLEKITAPILKEVRSRVRFLFNVGLGYLTLDRSVATLAGGELQRIRLAAQIGVGLTGVLYVLDEPSIGLHPRDNERLLNSLEALRDLKNTVLVVEHDEETMRRADYLIDLGPGAGLHGGELVGEGEPREWVNRGRSLTAEYLSGRKKIAVPASRTPVKKNRQLILNGCAEHNLKNIEVKIPLGLFVCVTGVSGSGKSTLVHDILYRELHNRIWKTEYDVGKFHSIRGHEHVDKIIGIDQAPIGRTPRSNPATYTDIFGLVRKIFSQIPDAKLRGYSPSRFSFNLKGGRCETCRGEGYQKLQMSFMPDIYVLCETCQGKRYNDATLDVRYRGKNISEALDLCVDEAMDFFENISAIRDRLAVLQAVGLGYLKLGQPSTTLSGGEAQRVKLAAELSKKATGKTLYLLDEPTTGLHFGDISNLLAAVFKLRDQGNTVVVIEHNLDVIKSADYIIDLGPEGGAGGGRVMASGTPEELARSAQSYTGGFLKKVLSS
ncbi:MAG: excinuclease ABC subunit A [Omnitrophica bacterium GWA2_52_8]|nr:MAG: excinuclease ABC subunit A [Omnitrophica bacterium GWA2_52_8]